jgi:hypothetical protein
MASLNEISNELREYLARIIDEDLDRNRDHLDWLQEHPDEPDRDQQHAECERAVEMARKAQALFPAPPEPEWPRTTSDHWPKHG